MKRTLVVVMMLVALVVGPGVVKAEVEVLKEVQKVMSQLPEVPTQEELNKAQGVINRNMKLLLQEEEVKNSVWAWTKALVRAPEQVIELQKQLQIQQDKINTQQAKIDKMEAEKREEKKAADQSILKEAGSKVANLGGAVGGAVSGAWDKTKAFWGSFEVQPPVKIK
jgi:predicted PurR-regulated permease PerM